jgi:hypothetical protein
LRWQTRTPGFGKSVVEHFSVLMLFGLWNIQFSIDLLLVEADHRQCRLFGIA